jgi:hypothetical protein
MKFHASSLRCASEQAEDNIPAHALWRDTVSGNAVLLLETLRHRLRHAPLGIMSHTGRYRPRLDYIRSPRSRYDTLFP